LTWRDYGGIFTSIESLYQRSEVMDFHAEKFFEDAAQGTLPNVSWLNSGFLIDGDAKTVYVYRDGRPPKTRRGVLQLAGEGSLEGFVLDLKAIWKGLK